jgi:hypothetical protein
VPKGHSPAGAAFPVDGHDGLELVQNNLAFALVEFKYLRHELAPLQGEDNQGDFLAASLAQEFDAMSDFGLIHNLKAVRPRRYNDSILMQMLFPHEE